MNRNHPDYGRYVVDQLREKKLRAGLSFMIFEDDLPERHYYFENPDGSISIKYHPPGMRGFKLIKFLSEEENRILRKKLNLQKII